MAVVKLGATVVGVSGSIGGVTYARNKAGWTAKSWARPCRMSTQYQALARGYFAKWSPIWQTLSASDKASWDSLAADPPETDYDRFGAVVLRSGWEWFVRVNQRMVLLGVPPTETAPAKAVQADVTLTGFTAQVLNGDPMRVYVEHSNTEFSGFETAWFFMAIYPGPGLGVVRRGYKLLTVIAPAGTTSSDLTGGVSARFGQLQAGWLCSLWTFRQGTQGFRSVVNVQTAQVTT